MAETKAEREAREEAEKAAKEAAKAEAKRLKDLPRAKPNNALALILLRSLALGPMGLGRLGELLKAAANNIETGDQGPSADKLLIGIANALEDYEKDWDGMVKTIEALLEPKDE